jgi:hypothetical protein
MIDSTDDFGAILPNEITSVWVRSGNEWVIPLPQAQDAIRVATDHLIAVLGVDSLRIQQDGMYVVGFSGWDFKLEGDWADFVRQNNDAASGFINNHRLGPGYGYILTTTSETEFRLLMDHRQEAVANRSGLAVVEKAKRILKRAGRGKPAVAGDQLR